MTDDPCARVLGARTWRARKAAVIATVVGALLLAGCTTGRSVQQTTGGWFDRVLGRTTAEGQPRVSYAAAARIKVYSEPDAASSVKGLLNRYEEIARYQSQSGFAYVKAKGNLSGWVPESQLIERPPQVRKAAEVEPAQPAEATTAPGESAETPTTEAPTDAVPPEPGDEPLEPERSVFDPY